MRYVLPHYRPSTLGGNETLVPLVSIEAEKFQRGRLVVELLKIGTDLLLGLKRERVAGNRNLAPFLVQPERSLRLFIERSAQGTDAVAESRQEGLRNISEIGYPAWSGSHLHMVKKR